MVPLGVDGILQVALKLVKYGPEDDLSKHRQRLDRETCIWRRLNHRNIVPFFGAFDIDARCPLPVLISPYYEFGHIGMYLKRLARADRVQLMHDVVSGMKHLHDHGENILVDKHRAACVTDFGISRIQNVRGFTTSHGACPSVYTAPELWGNAAQTVACVLLGILTDFPLKIALPVEALGPKFIISSRSHLERLLRPTREQYDAEMVPGKVWGVLEKCWSSDPQSRPTMAVLLNSPLFDELVQRR
ncbi:kinase-like domain-containing protein [Mycena olivaceomarginata]|nr:kinase-like domain-containing protein [Mycena olivaceomarginata]